MLLPAKIITDNQAKKFGFAYLYNRFISKCKKYSVLFNCHTGKVVAFPQFLVSFVGLFVVNNLETLKKKVTMYTRCNALVKTLRFLLFFLCTDRQSICWCTSMFDISRYLIRSKQWVSRLVLLSLICHVIRFSALPARPLPVNRGSPHGVIIYKAYALCSYVNIY